VVEHGLQHFRKDGARLIRLHLQRIRNSWKGPGDTESKSAYIQYFVNSVDPLLAKLIAVFEKAGVWKEPIWSWDPITYGPDQQQRPPAFGALIMARVPGHPRPRGESGRKMLTPRARCCVMANYLLACLLSKVTWREFARLPSTPHCTLLTNIFEAVPAPSSTQADRTLSRFGVARQ